MTIDIDGLRKRLTEVELSFDEDFQQLEGHFRSSGDMVGFFQVLLDILDNGVAGSTVGRIRDALPNMLERWARDERGKAVKGQITQRVATLREACGDHDKAVDDIASVITRLKAMPECNGKIGVTGFCTGGTLT